MPSPILDPKYFLRHKGDDSGAPTLGLVQSFWALTEFEATLEQSLQKACAEGYHYFEAGLREDRIIRISSLLDRFPLQLIAQGWAVDPEEALPFFDRAADLGAIAINLHLGHAFLSVEQSINLFLEIQDLANRYAIPLMIETHRGRLTQDLFRARQIVERLPDAVFALNVSHYLVAGEGLGGSLERFRAHIQPLMGRAALLHGRISNGQSIQVSMDDSFAFTSEIELIWQQTMELWLDGAPDGAVFLFEPELGPPPYAYMRRGEESFSRTDVTRKLFALTQRAWASAKVATAGRMEVTR